MSAEPEGHVDDAERRKLERELFAAMQEEMRRIPVPDYLVSLLVSLSSMSFQRMGLTAETAGDRDLVQSRLAADAFAALVEVLAAERPAEEIALYRNTLHQMRLAYVSTVEHAAGDTPGPEATVEADAATGEEEPANDHDDDRADEESSGSSAEDGDGDEEEGDRI